MAARVFYKAVAEAEVDAIYRSYETERKGLGAGFLDELLRIEGHLTANPALYQRVDGDVRRAVLRRFPYGLFYTVDNEQVSVLACFHLHRQPRSREELLAR